MPITASIIVGNVPETVDANVFTSGVLPIARGGTGVSSAATTGSGNLVLSNGPTLSNVVVSDILYLGNAAANTALYTTGTGLGVRSNGVNVANITSTAIIVSGNVSASYYEGNGYGLTSINMANVQAAEGIISVANGGTGTTTSTGTAGSVVLSDGPTLSNVSLSGNIAYFGNIASNTAVSDAGSGVLSFRSNGVNVANVTATGLNVTGGLAGNALVIGSTLLQTGTSASYGSWTSRTSASDGYWLSVCWGSDKYVAVGYMGAVMTSPDGITWTTRTAASSNDWQSVCYGNGLFVAVSNSGTGNRVMTSPDGITWTSRTSAANNYWQSVCWGGNTYVGVGYTSGYVGAVMTSPDGITWTSRAASNLYWYGVCYGGPVGSQLFVAVGGSGTGNRVMTSPDGITWTSRTSAADNGWVSVCWGSDKFVAISFTGTGNRVMTSPDGITWTSRTSAAQNSWNGVCWGNSKFVAVSYDGTGDRVMSSSDGITWALETSAASLQWRGVCYGYDKFVAVASSGTGNRVMTSSYDTVPSLGIGKVPAYQLDLSLDTARKLTTTTWTTGSDERIKEDIELANLELCCDLVDAIPLKKFAWKTSYAPLHTDRHQLGWIAQDVEAAGLEKAVVTSNEHGFDDFRSLNTDQLYKVMWGALQKSIRKVRDLKARVQALEDVA